MIKITFYIFFILFVGAIGIPTVDKGKLSLKKHPYFASILYNKDNICAGSLISKNIVVTAAHCVIGKSSRNLQVRLGSSKPKKGGHVFYISTIKVHENFDDISYSNDIALLVICGSAKFSDTIQPIELLSTIT